MTDKSCPFIEVHTAIKKVHVGNTSNGPIYVEKEEVVNEECKLKNTSFFNCEGCKYSKPFRDNQDAY